MKKELRKFCFAIFAVATLLCFTACSALPEATEPTDPNLSVLEFTLSAGSTADLTVLEQYPNLKSVDLRGSNCHEAVYEYAVSNPQIHVQYDVQIGNERYDSQIRELTLAADSFEFQELLDNLAFLPEVTNVQLPQTTLTSLQFAQLRDTYPNVMFGCTVMVLGQELSSDVTELDLSALLPEQIDEITAPLSMLTSLTDIQLMDAEGNSSLGVTDVKKLMDAVPGAAIHYTFELYGQTLSTTDETVEYVSKHIGNDGVQKIREALDILPCCTYFKLDGCGISNEIMAQLRDDYPDTKIVWRISYGKHQSCLTDTDTVRCVENLTNNTSKALKYCTDVVYMDFGHNYILSDISFVSYMPNLKVVILGDSYVSDLTPLASCQNLQWLELVNCNHVTDLSPLANCTELRGLNISYTFSIDDLSPLYGLQKLERLFMGRHGFDQETIDAVREALPNCWVTDYAEPVAWIGFNYSVGWRLDDEHTFADWYLEIKDVFGYTREIS